MHGGRKCATGAESRVTRRILHGVAGSKTRHGLPQRRRSVRARPAFPAVTRPRCRRCREISSRAELPRKEPLPVADGSPAVNSFRRGCPNALAGSTAFEKGEDNAKIHALFTRDWRGWVDTVRSALRDQRKEPEILVALPLAWLLGLQLSRGKIVLGSSAVRLRPARPC